MALRVADIANSVTAGAFLNDDRSAGQDGLILHRWRCALLWGICPINRPPFRVEANYIVQEIELRESRWLAFLASHVAPARQSYRLPNR
jgi:hypothetical protein